MSITENDLDQIEETGKVPSDIAAQLLEDAFNPNKDNGDTIQVVEKVVDAPDDNKAVEVETTKPVVDDEKTPAEDPQDESNAKILAKDGLHTIPYERLVQAREDSKEWKSKAELLERELQGIRSQQQDNGASSAEQNLATAEAAIAASNNDVDVIAMFGDFSEKAIAEGVQKLVELKVPGVIEAAVAKALEPFQKQQQEQLEKTAEQNHFDAIFSVHPDAESIVESQEFNAWKDAQPSIIREAYNDVLNKGTATKINELLSLYKSSNDLNKKPEPSIDAIKEKAKQAVNTAQTQVPHSVSDLPAGSPSGITREERLKALSPAELAEAMSEMSPEEIDRYVARNV